MIELNNIHRDFLVGEQTVHALDDINLSIKAGEYISIMGPSGSGKSTLLHILGCLERPTSGRYVLDGKDVFDSSDRELSSFRANHIGFVFQTFNLLPQLTVLENVELPFLYASNHDGETERHVLKAIQQVGLLHRIDHRPAELSGGEMQRVAVCRALITDPPLLLADEPTGNLDPVNTERVLEILFDAADARGATLVTVTHEYDLLERFGRVVDFKEFQTVAPAKGGEAAP